MLINITHIVFNFGIFAISEHLPTFNLIYITNAVIPEIIAVKYELPAMDITKLFRGSLPLYVKANKNMKSR